jgi:hypothetical protein
MYLADGKQLMGLSKGKGFKWGRQGYGYEQRVQVHDKVIGRVWWMPEVMESFTVCLRG